MCVCYVHDCMGMVCMCAMCMFVWEWLGAYVCVCYVYVCMGMVRCVCVRVLCVCLYGNG